VARLAPTLEAAITTAAPHLPVNARYLSKRTHVSTESDPKQVGKGSNR